MEWFQVVESMTPYIFHIHTPNGSGTGFLFAYSADKKFCSIATALHVVSHADQWQQPIRLVHHSSQQSLFLKEGERVIIPDAETDSAVIFFSKPNFKIPEELIELLPLEKHLKIAVPVGWLGFPAISPNTLCFFSGSISARQQSQYLIDGVAIHGVSGGPVMYKRPTAPNEQVQLVGIVSAYQANRVTGEALPGLLYAQDVSHFHNFVQDLKSMEEAERAKQQEQSKIDQESKQSQSPTSKPKP